MRWLFEQQMAVRVGQQPTEHFAPAVLAECDLLEGHPERARARLGALVGEASVGGRDISLLLPSWGRAHLEVDDVVTAARLVGQTIMQAHAENDRLPLVEALRGQALVAIRQQHWEEATAALEEGLTLAQAMPYPYTEARLLNMYGDMCAPSGETELGRHSGGRRWRSSVGWVREGMLNAWSTTWPPCRGDSADQTLGHAADNHV